MVERSETLSAMLLKCKALQNGTLCGLLHSEAAKALYTPLGLLHPKDDRTMIIEMSVYIKQ